MPALSLDNGATYSWQAASKPTARPAAIGGGALATGDRVYMTNVNDWFEWNGTYWLGENRITVFSDKWTGDLGGTNWTPVEFWAADNYDVWVENLGASIYPGGTNTASVYAVIGLFTKDAANGDNAVAGATINTSGIAAANWGRLKVSVGQFLNLTGNIQGLNFVPSQHGAGSTVLYGRAYAALRLVLR